MSGFTLEFQTLQNAFFDGCHDALGEWKGFVRSARHASAAAWQGIKASITSFMIAIQKSSQRVLRTPQVSHACDLPL